MAWREAISSFIGSGKVISLLGGALVTGSYVLYKDRTRFPKMSRAYSKGQILPPLSENNYEVVYFPRPELERTIREILSTKFSNEYYLICGESGTGKTRTVVEMIRRMISEDGRLNHGAPIYVLAIQGQTLPETLATAVNFNFDEHISFAFFLDFLMRINTFPPRDDHKRLIRVLDVIEKSAFEYMVKTGRPIVLVVDGANSLEQYMPGALLKLQEKAKLWADSNIAKVIFISNDEETEEILQKQSSSWSRAASPILVEDLSREEAIEFLTHPQFMENVLHSDVIPFAEAEKIVDVVGGRIHHLIVCKRNWILGKPVDVTLSDLKSREREKFVSVSRSPSLWNTISLLRDSQNKTLLLSKLIKETSEGAVRQLAKENIVRYGRNALGTTVQFQSRLTENVVEDLQTAYVREKRMRVDQGTSQAQTEPISAESKSQAQTEQGSDENIQTSD